MKTRVYLLSVAGKDRPGFVAAVTKRLFHLGCNLEDSSMMRLGPEFGMFLILSSKKELKRDNFAAWATSQGLTIGLKSLPPSEQKFKAVPRPLWMVRVHGPDHPGIVYHITACLAQGGFNITDLETHQTSGKKPGYILLIEGELLRPKKAASLRRALKQLAQKTKTKITIDPLSTAAL